MTEKELEIQRAYRRKNRKKVRAWKQKYRDKYPEKRRQESQTRYSRHKKRILEENKWRKRQMRYGLSEAEYKTQLQSQGGVCAICKNPPTPKRDLDVDHDHATQEVRGLLCNKCNQGLGLFRDSPEVLEIAKIYLQNHGKNR